MEKTEYYIIKKTIKTRWCSACGGTGTEHQRAYHNRTTSQPCTRCKGKQKEQITHQTEVPLLQALTELGLIKQNHKNG